jgi:hypothetical protein
MESTANPFVPTQFPVKNPGDPVPGTVTIIPQEGNPPFRLSGSGEHWSAEEGELTLHLANRAIYTFIFTLSSSGFTFDSPALEISHGNQSAFICQMPDSGNTTVTVRFLNDVTQAVTYHLGFRIKDVNNNPTPWDPAVAFNPPDEGVVGATR